MEEKKLQAIKLTIESAEKVLQYLSNQPFKEVAELINMIQKSELVYQPEPIKD